ALVAVVFKDAEGAVLTRQLVQPSFTHRTVICLRARCCYALFDGSSVKVWVVLSNVTPAGRSPDRSTDSVVPSSASDALASAFNVEGARSSVASPCTAPVTTGASLVPVTVHDTDSLVAAMPSP